MRYWVRFKYDTGGYAWSGPYVTREAAAQACKGEVFVVSPKVGLRAVD